MLLADLPPAWGQCSADPPSSRGRPCYWGFGQERFCAPLERSGQEPIWLFVPTIDTTKNSPSGPQAEPEIQVRVISGIGSMTN